MVATWDVEEVPLWYCNVSVEDAVPTAVGLKASTTEHVVLAADGAQLPVRAPLWPGNVPGREKGALGPVMLSKVIVSVPKYGIFAASTLMSFTTTEPKFTVPDDKTPVVTPVPVIWPVAVWLLL